VCHIAIILEGSRFVEKKKHRGVNMGVFLNRGKIIFNVFYDFYWILMAINFVGFLMDIGIRNKYLKENN